MIVRVGIAMLLMITATVGVNLGLWQAISQVVGKICKCHKCLSFWLTLLGLIMLDCPIIYAVSLSLLSAYLSYWLCLLLILINKLYDKLWEKVNK